MTDTGTAVQAPEFRALNGFPTHNVYDKAGEYLRGREIVGPGYRMLVLEAKHVAPDRTVTLAIDAYGTYWIVGLTRTVTDSEVVYTLIEDNAYTNRVFRNSIFDAIADFAVAS